MKCDFCGKDTNNKYKNQARCKSHVVKARDDRDEHNKKVREQFGNMPKLERYIPGNTLEDQMQVTAGYCLNKEYKKLNQVELPKKIQDSKRF